MLGVRFSAYACVLSMRVCVRVCECTPVLPQPFQKLSSTTCFLSLKTDTIEAVEPTGRPDYKKDV